MTADFSGSELVLPPGIEGGPQVREEFPDPTWWSPAIKPSGHLLVGGRTVWIEGIGPPPAAIVLSHPNRFGGGEDLAGLAALAAHWSAEGWVQVDPLLAPLVVLPAGLHSATRWPAANQRSLLAAGLRSLQAADGLRRRLREVPGLTWPVRFPTGRAVTCVSPLPGPAVAAALSEVGVAVSPPGWWEGVITFTVGWWHRRQQLDGLAAALAAVLAGREPAPVPTDSFVGIPEDLPHRRLNRIMNNLRGA